MAKKKKEYKLIREIKAIIDNPDLHWWKKCKSLTQIQAHDRPGSYEGDEMIRKFFKTCAGRFQERFESAYVRPYLESWHGRTAHDYVNKEDLDKDLSIKIGRNPRETELIVSIGCAQRFDNYLSRKYPQAFEEFEEIKKVEWSLGEFETRSTKDYAWQHIFPTISKSYYSKKCGEKDWLKTTKEIQKERRKLDLAMEKAQADYKKLKKASKLPPRYLYNEVSLAELQNDHRNHTYAIFKGHYITTETVLHYDNKDVHHGLGHLVRTDRKLLIRNGERIVFSRILKSYAGHFILNAIEEHFGKVKKVKVAEELKPVQLNPKMEVTELKIDDNFRVFERLFAGAYYDCCVLRDGITYHGKTVKACIDGWKKKKRLSKAGSKIFNMKILRGTFGFCREGVGDFCSANGLDSHETYTLKEVKRVVNKNLSYNRSYFGNELRKVGVL